jgi:hypothetical protein
MTPPARTISWGRDAARRIAHRLGATELTGASNEFSLNGEIVVIKCVRGRVGISVEVRLNMLPRLAAVVAAFEVASQTFAIYKMPPERFKAAMVLRNASKAAKHHVGCVAAEVFMERAEPLGQCCLDE